MKEDCFAFLLLVVFLSIMYSLNLLLRTGCKGYSKWCSVKIPRLGLFFLLHSDIQIVSSNVNCFISLGLPVATMQIGADNNTGAKNLCLSEGAQGAG